jgi:hypothetical protein
MFELVSADSCGMFSAPIVRQVHQSLRAIASRDNSPAGAGIATWNPPQLAAVGASIASLATSDSDRKLVFETSWQLARSYSCSDSPAVLVCLCAYVCHALIQQGNLESELGETFVTSILAHLFQHPHQPPAEAVACDLFRMWAQRNPPCRRHLGALTCSLLRSLAPAATVTTPKAVQGRGLKPNKPKSSAALRVPDATHTIGEMGVAGGSTGTSAASSSGGGGEGEEEEGARAVSALAAVTCARELVEALREDPACASLYLPPEEAPRGGCAGGGEREHERGAGVSVWDAILRDALAVLRGAEDGETTRALINLLLPAFLGTPTYVSSYYHICVLILLYICPHTTMSVFSYYYDGARRKPARLAPSLTPSCPILRWRQGRCGGAGKAGGCADSKVCASDAGGAARQRCSCNSNRVYGRRQRQERAGGAGKSSRIRRSSQGSWLAGYCAASNARLHAPGHGCGGGGGGGEGGGRWADAAAGVWVHATGGAA